MTATEFLSAKCSSPSLPPDFDHLDMSLLCFLAGKHALAAAWAKQPCAVVGVADRHWRLLVASAQQRLADGQINLGNTP